MQVHAEQRPAATTAPTAAEMAAASVFTADGYVDDEGAAHITVRPDAEVAARERRQDLRAQAADRLAAAVAGAANPEEANLIKDIFDHIPRLLDLSDSHSESEGDATWSRWQTIRNAAEGKARKILAMQPASAGDAARRIALYREILAYTEGSLPGAGLNDLLDDDVSTICTAAVTALEQLAGRGDGDWDESLRAYEAASAASDACTEQETLRDLPKDEWEANQRVHSAWKVARQRLIHSPAPTWAGLGIKTAAFVRYFDDDTKWCGAAQTLIDICKQIGSIPPDQADAVDVLVASGSAEQIAFYLANSKDGYREWACDVGAVTELASTVELIVREARSLAEETEAGRAMSAAARSAVWFKQIPAGFDTLVAKNKSVPPAADPVTWASLTDRLETLRIRRDAASQVSDRTGAPEDDKVWDAADDLWSACMEEVINFPAETYSHIALKLQLGADRWVFDNLGETITDPDQLAKAAEGDEATRWYTARIYMDLQRLAGVEGECQASAQAKRFSAALKVHNELDGKRGASPAEEAECEAQWKTMLAAEAALPTITPASRAGVAFQLLHACGEIEAATRAPDEADREACGERIQQAIVGAINALGLPYDPLTAEFYVGPALENLGSAQ